MEQFLWTEKYRPRTVADTILPKELKATFQKFVDNKNIPNLLLVGKAGTGKTTIAKAMCEQLGCDYIVINGSLYGNIDTLRNDIKSFASSVSFAGGRKYVILDEADYLNANSTQPALRNFMEEYSRNCGFILTCNYPARIIKELHSRLALIEFKIPKAERPKLATEIYQRICQVLEREEITFNDDAVTAVVMKFFPDFRRMLNELQKYSATGKIDKGVIADLQSDSIKVLLGYMQKKEFSNVRKWVAENSDADFVSLVRRFYDGAASTFTATSIPNLVLILARYQYQAAFVADLEVNTSACLAEVMAECEFK